MVRRLEALYQLADQVARAKDVDAVCDAAVAAMTALGAARASVLLFDGDGGMRFRAWRNLSAAYRAAVDGHSPWSRDASHPSPIVIEDAATDPALEGRRDVVLAEGIRALAFVPLVSDGRLYGTLMVAYDAVAVLSPTELHLAASVAQHVGFGVARVLAEAAAEALRGEAERRRAVAEELARVARVMNETLDVGAVSERIVDAALTLFSVRASALRLAAPDGALVGVAFAGLMKEAFPVGHTIPAGPGSVSGLAMLEGRAVWSDDVFTDPRLALAGEIDRGMRRAGDAAVLAAPLRTKAKILGALSVADRLGRRFSSAEAETLQAFADQAALAIENARLYEEARRGEREADVVMEVVRRINASLDLHTTLERLVEGARDLCASDIARIVVRDDAGGGMRLRLQLGARWEGYHDRLIIEPGRGTGGIVLATGRPFRTDDYGADTRITGDYKAAAKIDGTVAQLVVPIPGETGIVGLLYVDRRAPRPFTDVDEAILVRLAQHAATAIRNSELFAAERAARAEADAANRGKDRFLAVLSHELRTPLNAILGWARLLGGGHLDPAQRARAIEVIERNAQLQTQLVADLLDISRVAAGKMEVERTPVDLVLVVREALEVVAADAEAKKLALVTDLDPAAGEVAGEARRLQQVVLNLLLNAIKFTPDGGRIEVRLERHETSARLTVHDTGEGIDPELLPRIFNPFEQGDATTTRRHQGLGLGLAIVRQLVELHGGTIRAESPGPGQGATFVVDLPVLAVRLSATRGRREAERETAPPGRLRGVRVLVVDDQQDACDLLAFVLGQHGAEAHVTASAAEALAFLRAHEIDVLVSDISMPGMDGYALLEHVRALAANAPPFRAVAVTAFTGHAVRDRALSVGFDAHVSKPLDPDDFVRLLDTLLQR